MNYNLLKNRSLLLTGATGVIGSCLTHLLLSLNNKFSLNLRIVLLVRSIEKAVSFFGTQPCIEYYLQDVNNPITVNIGNIDYFILAACNAYPEAYKEVPVAVMNANYLGVNNIFDYIISRQYKPLNVLFVSSSEIYGEYECGNNGINESFEGIVNHYMVRASYTESKRAAETLCLSYASQYGINTTIARPGYVFGPIRMTKNNRADVEFFNCVKNRKPIVMRSVGNQQRSYCYVEDAAYALLYILLKGKSREAYNIALDPKDSITIAEFASLIAEIGKVDLIKSFESRNEGWSPFSKAILNNEKLKELGWLPRYTVREGIERTISQMKIDDE